VTAANVLLEAGGLTRHFAVHRGVLRRVVAHVRAVDGVSFRLAAGETLSLVGESGSGKTTVGRLCLRLLEPTSGTIRLDGESLLEIPPARWRRLRRQMQIVFQDPAASLNPRLTAGASVAEGLEIQGLRGGELHGRVADILARVGLDPLEHADRYPHELSGGQKQRVAIARALVVEPRLLVCDEPVSSLDVSVQAQILNLLERLKAEAGFTCLFISHDLAVVRHLSDHVAVMYLGRIVESGPAGAIFATPHHPYTRALLDAVPASHPRDRGKRQPLAGEVPSPMAPPPGCRFHPRCPVAMDRCRREEPPERELGGGHVSACWLE
jgi:oligopeptide/dipeptide ABC transporter ATP-binding protein